MKFNVEFKNFEPEEPIRKLIGSEMRKLERKIRAFSRETVVFRISVEENRTRVLYRTSLTMEVPEKTLVAKEERHDVKIAIKDAFAEIDRQLTEHKSRLRKEHLWKRPGKREELRKLKIGAVPAGEREAFFSLVSPCLDRLYHFVRHVIRYSEETGELVRGETIAEDIVDASLVRGYQEFLIEGFPRQEIGNWLIRIAVDQFDTEVNRLKSEHAQEIHVEEDIPETPPAEEVSTLGEEIMYYYQPDEDLKVEDVVADPSTPTPEQLTEARELRSLMGTALAEMPKQSRRILVLCDIEGRPTAEIAEMLGRSETDVERILKRTRVDLRKKLMEYGYGVRRAA